MMEYTLGIDLGTSGVKAGLVNLVTLELECVATRSYPDDSEQDLEKLWIKTAETTREAMDLSGKRGTVRAIGLTGQMHGAVLFDAVGNPIGPLINWKDQKWSSKSIIQKMKLALGDRAYNELGTDISSGLSGAILFGIKENDPDLFRKIAHFVLPTDFLRGKLLGKPDYATDQTNACGTGLYNTMLNCWHGDIIRKLQLPLKIFPEVHPASEQAGIISDQAANFMGLPGKIPIIYGGGDNQMSMLGSGLSAPGSPILINIGTASQISKVILKYDRYPGMDTRTFFDGTYALVGASLGGGSSYQWLREQIIQTKGFDISFSKMDEMAAEAPPGADGLVFCTGPTRQKAERRRGFYGKTAKLNSISHRAKAVMEGVLMDLFKSYEVMKMNDLCDYLMAGGKGLQKGRVWSQVTADLFGKPVRLSGYENAVFGAALMAAYGLGFIKKPWQSSHGIAYASEMIPDKKTAKFYKDEFVNMWRAEVPVQ